ncbi:hypothetical protein FRB94_008481 [Tulasnella sp. JGI-2019a]|nr:hypothetical protein FRB93_010853 [Tulasnella sp. JGI-2019a]KAG9011410.1 hypothetical protein FRB94_008481 [Tulasnella sp. JGI-2019a]KAG9036068.1 hypothetical protein FRB95_009856 [Tulasnella sp. JGI-2019a]
MSCHSRKEQTEDPIFRTTACPPRHPSCTPSFNKAVFSMAALLVSAALIGAAVLLQKIARDPEGIELDGRDLQQFEEPFDVVAEGSGSSSGSDGDSPDTNLQQGTCSACLDGVVISPSPSLRFDSSVQYGINLACPFSHTYCLSCFEMFIKGKLYDANQGKQIFPLKCPDCSPAFNWSLSDEIIREAIPPSLFRDWSTQRYLDNLPKMYCPNPRCSEVIALSEDNPLVDGYCFTEDSDCPRCQMSICVHCRTVSHPTISCSVWQRSSLNPALSNPYDVSLRRLANRKHWRRCSRCRVVVEKTDGCSHMTCRCGHQFCHLCGSDWAYNGCTNSSPKTCNGKKWRADPTLHVPSRWKGVLQRTGTLTIFEPNPCHPLLP